MKRVIIGEARGRKPRSRLKSRLYVAWLALVCIGLVSAAAWMAPQDPSPARRCRRRRCRPFRRLFRRRCPAGEPLLGEKFSIYEKSPLCQRSHRAGRLGLCLDARRAG